MAASICAILLVVSIRVLSQSTTDGPGLKTIQDICDFLIKTDLDLVKKYSVKSKGEGEGIMTMIRHYNDNLAKIVKQAADDFKAGENTTISQAKSLIDHGGPQFINMYVEKNVLEERFGLNNISSRILCSQRQNTIDIWQDFYTLYSKIDDEDG